MLTRQALLQLGQFRSPEQPVISLYLTVDRDAPQDQHLIRLKNQLATIEEQRDQYDDETWQGVEGDMKRIHEWVRAQGSTVRGGQGLALFACGEALWTQLSLPYDLPTSVSLSDRPRLRPLYRLLQRFERYLAILSDARDARVFFVTPTETREVAQVEGDTPGRHDQGGWAQARIQRHQDKMVEEHLQNAAELAFRLFQTRGFDGVLLLGTTDRTSRLEDHLHPYLQQRVLDRQPMAMEASAQEVAEAVLAEAQARRRAWQQAQLDEWQNAAHGAANSGAAGLDATLRAAQQGQLMTLFLQEGLVVEGGKCRQCGALTTKAEGACDYCSGDIRRFDDVTEALTAAAMEQGAALVVLAADNDAAGPLADAGGVGAILRYATT